MNPFAGLFHYLRIFRLYIGRKLYFVFLLTALAAFAEGIGISLLLPLLKHMEGGGGGRPAGQAEQVLTDFLAALGIQDSLPWMLVLIASVFLLKGALKFAEQGYLGYLQARLLRSLKAKMFDAYSLMSHPYYLSRNTGYFINIINGQVNTFYMAFRSFASFLSKAILTLSYIGFAFLIAWKFALMAVGVGFVLLLLFRFLSQYVKEYSRKRAAEAGHLNKLLVQVLQGFKYITSTGQKGNLRHGVVRSIRRLTAYELRQQLAQAFTTAVREPIAILFIVGIILIQVVWLEASLIPIFVAILLFYRGLNSVILMQVGWQKSMNNIGAVELVHEELVRLEEHKESNGETSVGELSREIEIRNLSFSYPSKQVLRDINVVVPKNRTIGLVGESGAGKSTLIDIMTLLLKPTKGELFIDGTPWSEIELGSWRRQIGYVSQDTVVFDDTIKNNICLWARANESDLESSVREAARKAHLEEFVDELESGFDTVVGDRGMRLSGGQRQRLFIARELFKQPNLLILDEATSALDSDSERLVQESIDDLKGRMTVVMIAHRLSTIRNVDYLYVLDRGRIIEEGSYEELRERKDSRFGEMVRSQAV